MEVNRRELKRLAKDAMRGVKPAPYWVTLAMVVITLALTILSMSLTGQLKAMMTMYSAALEGRTIYVQPTGVNGVTGWALNLALEVMSMVIGVGFVIYCIRVWRREETSMGNLFDGFGVFFRALAARIIPSLLVSLWSLIYAVPVSYLLVMTGHVWWAIVGLPLLIPAIRASYAYRQTVYIMLDNPNMPTIGCVGMSRSVMLGHKWELFKLDMSFLGWLLLCGILPIAGLFLMVWVNAYYHVTFAGYYEDRIRDFMARNAPAVEDEQPRQPWDE